MTSLTKNKDMPRKEGLVQSFPVEDNVHIYKGALVGINSWGYAIPANDATERLKFVGVAYEECDNTLAGRSRGGKSLRVHTKGVFELAGTTLARAMVGRLMYVTDDQTVDATSTNLVCVGRLVEYVSGTKGWVDIGQRGISSGEPHGGFDSDGNFDVIAGNSFTCDAVTARIAQGVTGLTRTDHPTFDYITLTTVQGVTGLTPTDRPVFASATLGYLVLNGRADCPLDLSLCTPNVADVRLNNDQVIRNAHCVSRAAARALMGDACPLGSIVIGADARGTTRPDMYIKTASAGADTDWERVVTQAAD